MTTKKQRYFVHKCRSCSTEKLVLATKAAAVPSCCPGVGRMAYVGVREALPPDFMSSAPELDAGGDPK
jgi:hypothetical protein